MDHKTTMLLERAQQEAKDMGNMYIGSEHLLLAFAWDTQNPLYDKLRKEHIDYEKIKKDLLVLFGCGKSKEGEVLYSDTVIEILEKGNTNGNGACRRGNGYGLSFICIARNKGMCSFSNA